jgi:hypothetical protein
MDDKWESAVGLSVEIDDSALDPDKDGLLNKEEYLKKTDPLSADSDGDGRSDAAEIKKGRDPINKSYISRFSGVMWIPFIISFILIGLGAYFLIWKDQYSKIVAQFLPTPIKVIVPRQQMPMRRIQRKKPAVSRIKDE